MFPNGRFLRIEPNNFAEYFTVNSYISFVNMKISSSRIMDRELRDFVMLHDAASVVSTAAKVTRFLQILTWKQQRN